MGSELDWGSIPQLHRFASAIARQLAAHQVLRRGLLDYKLLRSRLWFLAGDCGVVRKQLLPVPGEGRLALLAAGPWIKHRVTYGRPMPIPHPASVPFEVQEAVLIIADIVRHAPPDERATIETDLAMQRSWNDYWLDPGRYLAFQEAVSALDRHADNWKEPETPASPQRRKGLGGRPRDTDPQKDRRIAQAWNSGEYKTFAELELALKLKPGEAKLAIDRHRKREKPDG